jgi:hypothetical protein
MTYGIGVAVADNIGGLWKKYDHTPSCNDAEDW